MAWLVSSELRILSEHPPRHRRVVELLGIVWILSLADLFFTLWAHQFTEFHEVNPIARAILLHGTLMMLVFFKVTLTSMGTLIFWNARRYGRAEIALWGIVLVYVALAFQWSHYTRGAIAVAIR